MQNHRIMDILHKKSPSSGNLLSIVTENDNVQVVQKRLIELEAIAHNWNTEEFQLCLQEHIGTNDKSLAIMDQYKSIYKETKGLSKKDQVLLVIAILACFMKKMIPLVVDIGTDISLSVSYYMSQDEIRNCGQFCQVYSKAFP